MHPHDNYVAGILKSHDYASNLIQLTDKSAAISSSNNATSPQLGRHFYVAWLDITLRHPPWPGKELTSTQKLDNKSSLFSGISLLYPPTTLLKAIKYLSKMPMIQNHPFLPIGLYKWYPGNRNFKPQWLLHPKKFWKVYSVLQKVYWLWPKHQHSDMENTTIRKYTVCSDHHQRPPPFRR